jgi:hypothetical protein
LATVTEPVIEDPQSERRVASAETVDRCVGNLGGSRVSFTPVAERKAISMSVIKSLFGASSNVCAYTGCEERLTEKAWNAVNGEVAHICGARPNAQRYDPAMSDAERNSFDNLILLCPKHHALIDQLDPAGHTVDNLREMKAESEVHSANSQASFAPSDLTRLALLLLGSLPTLPALSSARPQIVVRRSGKRVTMMNVGSVSATKIAISDSDPDLSPVLFGDVPSSLPPQGRFDIGLWALAFGSPTFAEVTAFWEDPEGNSYVETFPVN